MITHLAFKKRPVNMEKHKKWPNLGQTKLPSKAAVLKL